MKNYSRSYLERSKPRTGPSTSAGSGGVHLSCEEARIPFSDLSHGKYSSEPRSSLRPLTRYAEQVQKYKILICWPTRDLNTSS